MNGTSVVTAAVKVVICMAVVSSSTTAGPASEHRLAGSGSDFAMAASRTKDTETKTTSKGGKRPAISTNEEAATQS